jgi:endonuclease-3 related protein
LRTDLRRVFRLLSRSHGPQHWWPADTRFEILVGAVLTQNTSWNAVERALDNLRSAGVLDPHAILSQPLHRLFRWLRPSGYFRVKTRRLRNLCDWFVERGGFPRLARRRTGSLRRDLLNVTGVGPETADDILLYAFNRPVFVIDAYTRRLFARLGLVADNEAYEPLRARIESALGPDTALFNEFHALIVRHGKEICRKHPLCERCLLAPGCPVPKTDAGTGE